MNKSRHENWIWKGVIYLFLLAGMLFMLMPFYWMISTSLKSRVEAMSIPIVWIPENPNWDNYRIIFSKYKFLNYYRNTIIVTFAEVGIQCFTCTMAGYAFARLRVKGKNAIFFACMTVMMVPSHMMMIPRFLMMQRLNLLNQLAGIILPNLPSIYGVFLLRQHFSSLPRELDESATIDGCGFFRIYWQICLPLIQNGLIAFVLIQILWAWNDMLWPMIVIQRQKNFVLTIAITAMQGQYSNNIPLMMTGGVIAMIPMLVLFIFGQRHFLEGIARSGVKG